MNGLAAAQRVYDRSSPDDRGALYDAAEEQDLDREWKAPKQSRMEVTDAEIEETIQQIADTGYYDDELGRAKAAGDVHAALATDWLHNRAKLPGTTYMAFLRWATDVTKLAKYGK